MGSDGINIKLAGDLYNPQVIYSKQVNPQQDLILRNRASSVAIALSQQLSSQINTKDIKQVNMSVNGDRFDILVKLSDRDISLSLDSFDPKLKNAAEKLIDVAKRLKIFKAKEVSSLASYQLIPTHFKLLSQKEQPKPQSFLHRIHAFFQRFFSYHITVFPLVRSHIQEIVRGKSVEELKNLYTQNKTWMNPIIKDLSEKDPHLHDLFTDQELLIILNEQFVEEIRKSKKEGSIFTDQEIYRWDMLRVLEDLKEHPTSSQGFQSLDKIDPLLIPLKELSEVPVTLANSDAITTAWKNLLGNLFQKGQLGQLKEKKDTKDIILQTGYAAKYLEALYYLPPEVRRDLRQFLEELDKFQSSKTIEHFVIQRSTFLSIPLEIDNPRFQQEQEIYLKKVHPAFVAFANEQVSKSSDASALIETLAFEGDSLDQLENLLSEIDSSLSAEEKKLFDRNKMRELFFNELERIAVFDYHFLSSQIDNLREIRQDYFNSRKQAESLEDAFSSFRDKSDVINKNFQARLIDKQKEALSPFVKIPALDLPIALASKDDREQAVNSYLHNLKGAEVNIRKNIKTLEKEIKALKKKPGKGQKAIQQKEDILKKDKQIEEFDTQLEQIARLKKAQASGNKWKFDELLSRMTHISVASRTVHVNELTPVYLQALGDSLHQLEKDLAAVEETISSKPKELTQKEREEIKPELEEKIVSLKQLFEQLTKLKKQQDEISQIQQEKEKAIADLKQEVVNLFDSMLQEHPSIQPLIKSQIFLTDPELYQMLWKHLFENMLSEETLKKINASPGRLTEKTVDYLRPYIQAKAAFLKVNIPEDVRGTIAKVMEEIEGKITHTQMHQYLESAVASYKIPSSLDLVFGPSVIQEIRSEKQTSPLFDPKQQAELMIISRVLSLLERSPKDVTAEDKNNLRLALKEIEKDPSIKGKLEIFAEDEREDVEQFLKSMPSFLHGILRRFISIDLDRSSRLKIPGGITTGSIDFLKTYFRNMGTFTKYEKQLEGIYQQVDRLIEKYETDPKSIQPEERLTLRQMGVLSRFARLNEPDDDGVVFLEELKNLGLIEGNDTLNKLFEMASRAKASLDKVDKIIRPAIDQHYADGSLLAYVGKKKADFLGKPISFEEQLTTYAANGFTHGAKLYHQDGRLQISQIYGNYEQDPISLYQLCISNIWELDISPLIPKSMIPHLIELYGEEWQKAINQRYQEIERSLHMKGEKQFGDIVNNQERRIAAGFADHPLLFKLLGKPEVKGHERDYPKDFDKLHQKFFEGEPPQEEQICSEFASKTTLVCMYQLNKELAEAIHKKIGTARDGATVLAELGTSVPDNVREYLQGVRHKRERAWETDAAKKQLVTLLKKKGYDQQAIEEIIRLGDKEVFDLPYKKTERLKAIHPGRMVQLLTDRKCAKLKPPPAAVSALIAI